MDQFKVLLVDHGAVVRAGIRAMLENEPSVHFTVFESAGTMSLAELSRRVREINPDLILTGLIEKSVSGEDLINALRTGAPDACITVIAADSTNRNVAPLIKAGAHGYLHVVDISQEVLMDLVRHARDGRVILKMDALRSLLRSVGAGGSGAENGDVSLTAREMETLNLVANGLTNGEIGDELGISVDAVKTHVSNLMRKFGARGRAHLSAIAAAAGIVQLNGAGDSRA